MPKRTKMTRRKRKEQFEEVGEWLIHKTNKRRKKEEEGRKLVAGRLDREFKANVNF